MPPVACQGYLNAAKTALSVSPGSSALSTDLPNLQSTFGTVLERQGSFRVGNPLLDCPSSPPRLVMPRKRRTPDC